MLVKVKSNFSRERKEKWYQREVALILYKVAQENNLPATFSVSYCILGGRSESLKVYLNFSQKEKSEELLEFVKKEYSPIIKREIARSKKFSHVPKLTIFLDKEIEKINALEEIIWKIK